MQKNRHTIYQNKQAQGELPLFSKPPTQSLRIIRLPEVINKIGLRRASIYHYISEGRFPKPIHLGARAVGWLEHEIDEWLCERLKQR